MSRQLRQYLRRSLCGMLSAAMIATSLIVPNMTVYAAPQDDEASMTSVMTEDEDAVQNPDAGIGDENIDSGEGDENVPEQPEEDISKEDDATSLDENVNPEDEENRDIKDDAKENDGDVEEAPDGGIAVIATQDKNYANQSVTLNYYIGDLSVDETVGFYKWAGSGSDITVNEATNPKLGWKAWDSNDVYQMNSVSGHDGWYNITFNVTGTLTIDSETNKSTASTTSFSVFKSTNRNESIFECSGYSDKSPDIYVGLLDGTMTAVKDYKGYADIAAADGTGGGETTGDGKYTDQEVTLNYYVGDLEEDETVGFYKWVDTSGNIEVDTSVNPKLSWGTWGDPDKNPVYRMNSVTGHAGWYHIAIKVTDTIKITDVASNNSGLVSFSIYKSSADRDELFKCDAWNYPEIYKGLLDGSITAVKDGKGYASIEDAGVSKEDLEALVVKAKKLKEEDYKAAGWKKFLKALEDAETVLRKDEPTDDEIEEAYENLEKAMDALVPSSAAEAEINVKPVALANDFITGADISSYWALRESGTVFKDENGNELSDAEFFKYLYDGGTNWVRIRVWNNPYDSAGHGYGGGNNDLDKAKKMGKLATDVGMKVLIDFHYSDFWADPGKQQAPKAWASLSVDKKADAVYQFTLNSLKELAGAGVDVGMVQVGNETTNGICGVMYNKDGWAAAAKIYNAGSKAVREFDENCLVAIHFTNPERSGNYASLAKNLNDQKVDYDVFASSYYPFWHGTTDNLTSVLADVAKTYGKKVMVAETSWATTLDDQDGHDNTVRKGQNDSGQPYAFSVQGQADEIRAVVEAANNVNSVVAGSSIGVFYWESAWLSPYYVYDDDGNIDAELLAKNKEAWEKYGSGWAASYGGSYDAEDAGKWYGGSAVDNQAWFGFDGSALPTAKVYSYIRTGAIAEKAVSDVVNPSITINAEESFDYPDKVKVNFNDGTSADYDVTWDKGDIEKVDTEIPGHYEVSGEVTCEYTLSDGSTRTETKKVTLTITVRPVTLPELINPGFEDTDMSAWEITGNGTERKKEDPRSGSFGVHFWDEKAVTSTVMQEIEDLDAGTYVFGGYIQGDATGTTAEAVVKVYSSDGTLKDTKTAPCTTEGWAVWQNPEVTGIVVGEGDSIEVGMKVNAAANGWGTMDDFYLYATEYGIVVADQNKNGTLSASAAKSAAKETITITAAPKTDYILTRLTISGKGVNENTLISSNDTVVYNAETKTAVLTYSGKVTGETTESFIMPKSMVKVSAVFRTDVDVTALDQLIETCEQVEAFGYTEESWTTFTDALKAAKAASENVDATQAEIDSAKEALETAYNGLKKAAAATQAEIDELSALIEEYEQVKNVGYTVGSWKKFEDALAAAKAVLEREDVTTADIARAKAAIKKAYEELIDLTALNALIANYESVTNDGYTDKSWRTFKNALKAAKKAAEKANVTQAEVDSVKAVLEKAYAGLTKGLRAEWTDEWAELLGNDNTITYTGKAIKPTVKVYDGETLLTSKSYSVSYKNNTKVGKEGEKASVIIKGKGNYTGSYTLNFSIASVDLATDSDVSIADLYVAASKNGKPVSVKPVVTWKGKKVDAKKYYEVELPEKAEEGAAVIPYVTPGTYKVVVKAKEKNGIYTGSREIKITLVDTAQDANVLMSAVKVKFNFKSKKWTEGGVTLDSNDIKVTYKKKDLTFDTDYELTSYENNDRIGTATVVIAGKGKYVGELKKTFKITGTAINKNAVKLDTSATMVYNGSEHRPTVTVGELVENKDYKVTYQNNVNAGKKATAVITGINAYSGTVKKTFKIAAYDVTQAGVSVEVTDKEIVYAKGGSKPPVEVTFNGEPLVQGKDYTVSYAKNTKVTEGATAEVKITGKGNFTKKKTVTFAIGKQSLDELTATAADQTKAKNWNKVSPVITDLNGKALKKGTDYEKKFTYTLYNSDGTEVTDTKTTPAAGMRVEVTATGKGNYEGTITAEYRIIDSKKSIAGARIKIKESPIYTGQKIELEKSNITLEVKDGKNWIQLADGEYEIVGYSNNINKGKAAKVTIHGLAPYGGTKTFKFEIKAQSMEGMSWAERIASMFEMIFN